MWSVRLVTSLCGFGRACLVNSMPVAVVPNRSFNMYFSMPFGARARITLENQHKNAISAFFYQIDYTVNDEPFDDDIAYFHAQWRRQRLTEKGRDYVVLDGVKGEGHYVGTYLALTTLERYWWGEGELKFYIDDDEEGTHDLRHRHQGLFRRLLELRQAGQWQDRGAKLLHTVSRITVLLFTRRADSQRLSQ